MSARAGLRARADVRDLKAANLSGLSWQEIYNRWYAQIYQETATTASFALPIQLALGSNRMELPGWIADQKLTSMFVLRHGSLVVARPGDYLTAADGVSASLMRPAVWLDRDRRFVWAQGRRPVDCVAARSVVRIYVNLRPDKISEFVAQMRDALDRIALSFDLKASVDPRSQVRCDSAVVYIPERSASTALEVVERLCAERAWSRTGTPRCTLPVAAGVAVAREPSRAASFGVLISTIAADVCASSIDWATWSEASRRASVDPHKPWRADRVADPWGFWRQVEQRAGS